MRLTPILPLLLALPGALAAQGAELAVTQEPMVPKPPGARSFGGALAQSAERCAMRGHDPATSEDFVAVYLRQPGGWSLEQIIPESSPNAHFGSGVSLDNQVLAIGSRGFNGAQGRVDIYRLLAGSWTLTDTLQPSNPFSLSWYGSTLALDGDRLLVGAPGQFTGPANAGRAFMYVRTPGGWAEERVFTGASANDEFGRAVALRGDRALVGAPSDECCGWSSAGTAKLYRLQAGGWTLERALEPDVLLTSGMAFGAAVALDEDLLVIGADNAPTNFNARGAVFVFEPDAAGAWTRTARLHHPGATSLGRFVAVDDGIIAASAPSDSLGGNPETGTLSLYRCGDAGWQEDAFFASSGSGLLQRFGYSLSMRAGRVLVGASYEAVGHPSTGVCFSLDVRRTPVGAAGCAGVANSTGSAAISSAHGSDVAAANALTVEVAGLPPFLPGYLLASRTSASVVGAGGSQGTLCVGGNVARFTDVVQVSGAAGAACRDVPLTAIPTQPASTALSGETWYFQYWYRDLNPGPTSNFSSSVAITFQ